MAILFLDRYSQGQCMQLMWLSGPTGNVRTISITFRTVLMSCAVVALFLLSAGFLLHFVGFKIAVEYNPDLARSIGGVTTEAEMDAMDDTIKQEANASAEFAIQSENPAPESIFEDVYWEVDNNTEAGNTGRHFFGD